MEPETEEIIAEKTSDESMDEFAESAAEEILQNTAEESADQETETEEKTELEPDIELETSSVDETDTSNDAEGEEVEIAEPENWDDPEIPTQYTSRTQAEAIQWVKSQVGKSIDADGVYGAQCVDLVLAYYDYLGVSRSSGNGSDYTWNKLPSGWTRIAGAVPQPGDILVYTGGYNNYGHVAIFESTYSTYHQRFNNHTYVERVTSIAYNGFSPTPYWGVIRPNWKSEPTQTTVTFGSDDCQWDTTNGYFYTIATANCSGRFTEAGMTVWDSAGNVVASKTEAANTSGSRMEIWYNITNETGAKLTPGRTYTYQVYTVFNGARYYSSKKSFTTNCVTPGMVTNVAAYAGGKQKTKITWNPVSGAEGYLIYAQKNGTYGYCGMTSSTSFVDTKALDGTYNFYWVFAYVKNEAGKMTVGGCANYAYAKGVISAVKNLKATSVVGGVKLSWSAAAGADGYLIYGIRAGGSYGYVGKTAKGTTFIDRKASKTAYNFYWVYPYHTNSSGKMIVGGTPQYTYGRAR